MLNKAVSSAKGFLNFDKSAHTVKVNNYANKIC